MRNHHRAAVCNVPGCPALTDGGARCDLHKPGHGWATSTRKASLPRNWTQLRERVLKRDGRRCVLCGQPANQVDHIGDRADHSLDNLRALCEPCHKRRTQQQSIEGNRRRARNERAAQR